MKEFSIFLGVIVLWIVLNRGCCRGSAFKPACRADAAARNTPPC